MTNKEAIEILKNIKFYPDIESRDKFALDMAIKALEREDNNDIFICRKVSAGDLL